MLKWLRLLAFPALIVAVILVTRHYKDYDTSPKGYDARCIQENQSSAAAGYLVCSIETNQKVEPGQPQLQWWDKLLSWPEGITAWLVLFTLYAIVWQSWETRKAARAGEKSADAALSNAQAVINAERAWILVKRLLPPKDLLPPSPLTGTALEDKVWQALSNDATYANADSITRGGMMITKREEIRSQGSELFAFGVMMIAFKFKVYGNTPAKITECALIFRVVDGRQNGTKTEPDLIEPPDYGTPSKSDEIPDMGSVFAPSFTFTAGIPLQGGKLRGQEVSDIMERKKFLCAYGFISYRDAFEGTPLRTTRFCYVYDVRNGGVYVDSETSKQISPDAFRVGGPDSYNQAD